MWLYWKLVIEAMLIATPIIALAAWGISKLLVKSPPRGWWNNWRF